MPYIPNQQSNTGWYVPTTAIWDVARLYEVDVGSLEFKELLVRLYQNVNLIALSLNQKETGLYLQEELAISQAFFNATSSNPNELRPCYRLTLDGGALAAGTTNVPHGLTIDSTWVFTHIYGAATDNIGNNYYPLPFASDSGTNNIEMRVDGTNVVIINDSGVAFTASVFILEYVKQ